MMSSTSQSVKTSSALKITCGQSIVCVQEELNWFFPKPAAAVLPTAPLTFWVQNRGKGEENGERKVTMTEPFSAKSDSCSEITEENDVSEVKAILPNSRKPQITNDEAPAMFSSLA